MKCTRCGFERNLQNYYNHRVLAMISEENGFYLCLACRNETNHIWIRLSNFSCNEKWGNWSYIDSKLLILLQEARTIIGLPFIIHCAYETSGHSENSFHYVGQAVDFHVKEIPQKMFPKDPFNNIWEILNDWWPGGMGTYEFWNNPGFHLDVGPKRRWYQIQSGRYVT